MKKNLFIATSIFFILIISSVSSISWSGGGILVPGNITNFTQLLDTPSSYTGEAGNCAIVNVGEDALEFGACGGGGGGITNISEAGDVNVSGVADDDVLKWNDAVKKWGASKLNSIITFGDDWNFFSGDNEISFNETKLNDTIDLRVDSQLNSTNFLGSDFSGSTGDLNRTLNIGIDTAIVDMERQSLHPDIDYEITAGVLKIFLPVFDQFRIMVTTKLGLKSFNFLGTDLSGTNPTKFIAFADTPIAITLERQSLISNTDYTFNGTHVTFDVFITDQMRITIWE